MSRHRAQQPRMIPVRIKQTFERWSEAELEDGNVVKLKPVFTKVQKLEGQFDSTGAPTYQITSTNVVAVEVPVTPPSDKSEVH